MTLLVSISRRVVAAALALLLSGAPRIAVSAAQEAAAPACRCHHVHRDTPCDCPAARASAEAGARDAPACHRAARGKAAGAPERPAAPCVKASCGTPEARSVPPAGTDLFLLPAGDAPAGSGAWCLADAPRAAVPSLQREPELPPPRAA